MAKVVVHVQQGKILGKLESSPFFNSEFYSFYGIPYGEPPINELRFRDPIKAQPWKGIRDGTCPRDSFIQFSLNVFQLIGSEDALFVNIHTPELPAEGKPLRGVAVLIHPGTPIWGSPNPDHHGSPSYIMHHDVVYVTIAFRLSIFGFLNLNMKECSGNQCLKDIIMAFQWIRENIHVFNGDAENITAIGSSGGAALIHLLLLSPIAKGLFHKAIIMGQYAFNCLVPYCDDHVSRAIDFARELGFQGSGPRNLLMFLKKIPASFIVLAMKPFELKIGKDTLRSFLCSPFAESIDRVVIPKSPRLLISSMRQIPIIFGICEKEAIVGFLDKAKDTYERRFNTAYRQSHWGWMHNLTDGELDQLNNQIQSFYTQHLPKDTTSLCYKIDVMSDAAYSEVYDTLIDLISPNYPVYVYKFQYEGEIGFMKRAISSLIKENIPGTFHCDDYSHWAQTIPPKEPKTLQVINSFTEMFTSFVKTGNPNYENIETKWKPTTPQHPCYLNIDKEMKMIDSKLDGERFEFWDRMKKQFKYD